jgi:hypothetical protein
MRLWLHTGVKFIATDVPSLVSELIEGIFQTFRAHTTLLS